MNIGSDNSWTVYNFSTHPFTIDGVECNSIE